MNTEPELLNERLERLAILLDEIMPRCALLVRDALTLLKEQEEEIENLKQTAQRLKEQEARIKKYEYVFDFLGIGFREWATKILNGEAEAICEADEHEHKTVITFKLI